jgi:hypothetical protein
MIGGVAGAETPATFSKKIQFGRLLESGRAHPPTGWFEPVAGDDSLNIRLGLQANDVLFKTQWPR